MKTGTLRNASLPGRRDSVEARQLSDHTLVSIDAPAEVGVGDAFEVSMTVECQSFLGCATNTATISSGSQEFLRREDIAFARGDPVTLSTTISFDSPGDHTIQFRLEDQVEFHTVTVIEAGPLPAHELVSVSAPSTVMQGDSFEVTMTVECRDILGCRSQQATISAAGEEFLNRTVSFAPFDPIELSTSARLLSVGTETIQFRLGDQTLTREVTVESEFDPTAVEIVGCSVNPADVDPSDTVTLAAQVQNNNPVSVNLEVSWFASDLPGGPGVGPQTARIAPNDSLVVDFSFRPADVPEFQEFLADGFDSVITPRILPGSVEQAATAAARTRHHSPVAALSGVFGR